MRTHWIILAAAMLLSIWAVNAQSPLHPIFLIIDEDSIDSGNAPNFFSDVDVNDHIAEIGIRAQLPFFAANVGNVVTLHTGEVGDEAWFAPKTISPSWDAAGPSSDGLRNYLGNPSVPFPHNVGPGLGTADANGDRMACAYGPNAGEFSEVDRAPEKVRLLPARTA